MADGELNNGRKSKRNSDQKLGHEFKAKVSFTTHSTRCFCDQTILWTQKAGGDVKKGDVDPYAYVTLSQAAKSGRRGSMSKIGIAGKRR
jgi:ribosomal RNA-processing protein 12